MFKNSANEAGKTITTAAFALILSGACFFTVLAPGIAAQAQAQTPTAVTLPLA